MFFQKSFLGLLLLSINIVLSAQNSYTFSGRITDAKSGSILPGASVVISNEDRAVAADSLGFFQFKNLRAGHHIVEVSFAGYASIVLHIDLVQNLEKNLTLQPLVVENQGVTVTGVAGATIIKKTPAPVYLVKKSMLLQSANTNIIDALTRVPGVAQLSSGPAISKPFIRGLGYNRVLILNDGVRQEGQQWGDEHGVEVDEMSLARAEVLKGPASFMYGSDALAGVINLITNVPVANNKIMGNITSNFQSNNNLYSVSGKMAGNRKGLNWSVYGTYKSAGSYRNKFDGYVLNSGFNEKNAGGLIGLNKKWGYSHLLFSSYNQHLGLVEGDRDATTGQFILFKGTPLEHIANQSELKSSSLQVPMQIVQHNRIVSDNNFIIKKSRLKINLALQKNIRREFGNPEQPQDKELAFDLKTFTYNLQWQMREKKEWHTTIGINGMFQKNLNKGLDYIIPDYNLFDLGGFVYVQKFFQNLTLSGGMRFDNRSIRAQELHENGIIKFNALRRSIANFSGSIGLSYEPGDNITLKANIAKGFRSPSLAELSSNGAHEGTSRYEYGNNQLKPEHSLQTDVGFELHNEHLTFTGSLFYNRMYHFIFYSKLRSVQGGDSLVNVNNDFIPAFQFMQQNAQLYGSEFVLDIHPHPWDWLHFENTFSFVRGTFDFDVDNSKNLPLIPAAKWSSELRAEIKNAGKLVKNVFLELEMINTFKQNKPFLGFDTESMTVGYILWNSNFGAEIKGNRNQNLFSIYFSVLNIGDLAYQNHLSRLKYLDINNVTGNSGVYNAGRNFSAKINIPIDFKK